MRRAAPAAPPAALAGRPPARSRSEMRAWVRARRAAGRDRGSLSVELVVIAPGLVLLLLLLAAGARVVEVQGHIDGAARDAARAASIARSAGQAQQWALQAAQADLGSSSWCQPGSVQAPVTGFPGAGTGLVTGQDVTVKVSCAVNMAPFSVLGFTAAKTFSSQAVAPLDPLVCRTGTCG